MLLHLQNEPYNRSMQETKHTRHLETIKLYHSQNKQYCARSEQNISKCVPNITGVVAPFYCMNDCSISQIKSLGKTYGLDNDLHRRLQLP